MAVSAKLVKELREKTGAGMMDCKKVLSEADGNIEKAIDLLREKGLAGAEKKAGRLASEGIVETYIHGGKIAAIVEINSESVPKYSDIDISSGSIDYIIPDTITGFKLSYEKSSGSIESEFDLNNSLDNDKGTATYKKGSNKINAKLSSGSLDLVKYK